MADTLPHSWRNEFARAAAAKREEILRKEKDAWFHQHERRKEEQAADKQDDIAELAIIEIVFAPPEAIADLRLRLDEYDTATVEVLMEKQELIDAMRARIDAMRDEAHVLPDGRMVFKSRDGKRVVDERGVEISPEIIDPKDIDDKKPKWETYKEVVDEHARLTQEREEILEYQAKLDAARERTDRGDITQKELDQIEAGLAKEMPDAVREKLGLEKPQDHVAPAQKAEATSEAGIPANMDDLMHRAWQNPGPGGP